MGTTKTDPLAGAVADAVAKAAAVKPRVETGTVIAGPYPVGSMGTVEVRRADNGFTSAVYRGHNGGRAQRIPLAAVAALSTELG